MEKLTIEEMIFGIGIYPSLNAADKFALYIYLMDKYIADDVELAEFVSRKQTKELSQMQKASFASFLETTNIKREMNRYSKENIQWIHLLSPEYPEGLREIYAPPVVLFYKGNIHWLKNHTWLGVVGARDFTSYGRQCVESILEPLISKTDGEIGIVSGLAKGIDTEAHVVTMKNGGYTAGVIGTGLDQYYPSKNRILQQMMGDNQLVLSEYPMGSKPLKFHFPERNRIIAGLSRGVLVIEAKKRSGSLITAYNALDEGRDVFAVPGSIFEENRAGNHRLIQLGAILTEKSDDILKEWFYI